MAEGRATPEQQKRAMNHIVRDLCGTYDEVFIPDKMEETGYACGKRHVGLRIVFYVNLNTGKLAGKDEDGEQG